MKIAELRDKTIDQLKGQLIDSKKELFNLRFQKTTGELENLSQIKKVRRTIARIKTILRERVIAGESDA